MAGFAGLVDDSWLPVLAPLAPRLAEIGNRLRADLAAGQAYLPAGDAVLRALRLPLPAVRVLIVGQDPYPTPGHAVGLSFSVAPAVRPLPRSLANIFAELEADLGCPRPVGGDLSKWEAQGVLLLNRVLTVGLGAPNSHESYGWQEITGAVVAELGRQLPPPVAILWGAQAQKLAPLLQAGSIIASAHPSPLSAARGFFGSRPFSRANNLLLEQGREPVDWCLP